MTLDVEGAIVWAWMVTDSSATPKGARALRTALFPWVWAYTRSTRLDISKPRRHRLRRGRTQSQWEGALMSPHLALAIPGILTGEADGLAAVLLLAAVVLAVAVLVRFPSRR